MPASPISLPDSLTSFIERAAIERGYSSPSAYVTDLVKEDQIRVGINRSELEAALLEAFHEPVTEMTSADFDEIERLGVAELARRRNR